MKKRALSLLFALITTLFCSQVLAQSLTATAPNGTFSANDIEYWVGEGNYEVGIILINGETNYAFGYKMSTSSSTIQKVLEDIATKDDKFSISGEVSYGDYMVDDFDIDFDGDSESDYSYSSCSNINCYVDGNWVYGGSVSANKWISVECDGWSSTAASKTYTALSFGVITCPAPKIADITDITTTSAKISWTYEGTENEFWFYYKQSDADKYDSVTVSAKEYTLNSLNANTSYDYCVATICTDEISKQTSKKSFRTKCLALSLSELPYNEDFESYGMNLPYCWTVVENGTSIAMSTAQKVSGTHSLQIAVQTTAAYTILQELGNDIDISKLKVTLSYKCNSYVNATDTTFKIGLVDNLNGENFEELLSVKPETYWKKAEIRLDNITFDDTKRFIAIKTENNGNRRMFIDDVKISEVPVCEHPIINSLTTNLGSGDVDVAFTKGHSTDENIYIYYQKQGEETVDSIKATTSPTTITLELQTTYSVWAKTWCSGEESSDVFDTLSLTTPCANLKVPYKEDFTSYARLSYPMCYTKIGGYSVQTNNLPANEDRGMWLDVGHNGYSADAYVVLPYFETDAINNLRVSFLAKGASSSDRAIIVGVMTNSADITTFDSIKSITLKQNTWNKFDVDLDTYEGEGRYITFLFKNPKNSYNTISLDDISIDNIPDCDKPTDIVISQETDNPYSAVISFTKGNDYDEQWNLYYKKDSDNEYNTIVITENPFTLSGLDLKTTYQFYLTTSCLDNESEASSIITYQTPCYDKAISDFPYILDFEQDSLRCLTQELEGNWTVTGTSTSLVSYNDIAQGEKHAKLWSISGKLHARLVLPELDLTQISQPMVSFYHIQPIHGTRFDTLTVLYRTDKNEEWQELKKYSYSVDEWTMQYLDLPNPTATYQIAFEGHTNTAKGLGIDSISVYDFVCNSPVVNIDDSMCKGSTYTYYGNDYTEEGTFTIKAQGFYGCDTTINLTLTYKQPYDSTLTIDLCDGSSIMVNNKEYSTAGNYEITIQGETTCDTNIHLTINAIYPTTFTIDTTINEGDQIVVGNTTYYQAGTFTEVIPNAVGCDSTITINITVIPNSAEGDNMITKDDSRIIAWANGIELQRDSAAGNYYDVLGKMTDTLYVTLTNKGQATITFDRPIGNGAGYDFVVFSNGSAINTAFVEVSTNGKDYQRFNVSSLAKNTDSAYTNAMYNGLAGLYTTGYGVGFDLKDLPDNENIDKYNIRFVRIIDVKSGEDTDKDNNIIYDNDTEFRLAGIGVINAGSPFKVADMEGLLSEANTYEIVSPNVDNVENLGGGDYAKNYNSGGLKFRGFATFNGSYAYSWGPSNITDYKNAKGNGYSQGYYASSAGAAADGYGKGYLQAFFDAWNMAGEGCIVETTDSSTFYPQGVYVSNSVASYNYIPWSSPTFKGYHKIVAVGYDVTGKIIDTVGVFVEEKEKPRIKDWKYLDLSSLGEVAKLKFLLESDYTNQFGLEIDAYFCIDNLVYGDGRKYDYDIVGIDICEGDDYLGITQTGTYFIDGTRYDITVNPLNKVTMDTTICYGSTFEFNNKTYSATQIIIDTIDAAEGCDTVYTINLVVKEQLVTYDTVEIAANELPYQFGELVLQDACDTNYVFVSENGCDSTVYLHLTLKSSLEQITNEHVISIYPNPAQDNVTIEGKGDITIFNNKGQVIKQIKDNNALRIVDINELERGIYYVKIGKTTRKLIVE